MNTTTQLLESFEAQQWDGSLSEMIRISGEYGTRLAALHVVNSKVVEWSVYLENGIRTIRPDDYIIKGVRGEMYVHNPDLFRLLYEEVKWFDMNTLVEQTKAEQLADVPKTFCS